MTFATLADSATARLQALLNSPAADALMQEQDARDFDQRNADAAEWKRLDAAALAEVKAYAPVEAKLRAKCEAAAAVLRAAQAELHDAAVAHSGRLHAIERPRDRVKSRLHWSAPAAIADFETELQTEVNATSEQRDFVRPCFELKNGWSNTASIRARIDAILGSRAEVDALRYEALTPAALDAKFHAIRASWPAVERRPAAVA